MWRAHFGQTVPAPAAATGAIAEDPHPLDSSRPLPKGEVVFRALAEPGAVEVAPASTLNGDSARQPPALPGVIAVARPEFPAMGAAVATTSRENHALRPRLRDVPHAARHDDALAAWLLELAPRGDLRRGDVAFERGILRDVSTGDADGFRPSSDRAFELFRTSDMATFGEDRLVQRVV